MATTTSDLAAVQAQIVNRLDPAAAEAERIAGIIGDRPSQYAKSPSLWNAVFKALRLDAAYLPFDVDAPKLGGLVEALRHCDRLLGFSVTVPYKLAIIEHLDGLDEKARQIGAVNTVARTEDGRLIGYNTDGSGFLQSLTTEVIHGTAPLVPQPAGVDALLIGGGGAARAVAFYLAEAIETGRLFIANRTHATAASLAGDVSKAYGNARAIGEEEIGDIAPTVGLIVNGSTKGQAGLRKLSGGQVTMMEPYSALASADPARFAERDAAANADFSHAWLAASLADIERNHHLSWQRALAMPREAAAYDVIYAPLETVFLRHCRLSGHRTTNGKAMNIAQAVDACCDKVCRHLLREHGHDAPDARQRVAEIMAGVW